MSPTVSIIMSVYNSEAFLEEAVQSVQSQTLEDWELIAMDDGSSDSSFQCLEKMAAEDSRIRLFKMPQNSGAGAARDAAIRQARSRLIAVFDADDICEPERFEKQMTFLEAHPDVVAAGTQTIRIDAEGNLAGKKTFPTDPDELYRMMYVAVPIQLPTLMVNTALLPDDFDWFEGWRYSEDSLLFFKLAYYGKIANLPEALVKYRFYPESTFCRQVKTYFFETWKARGIARRRYEYEPTLRGRLTSGMQFVVVSCIPNALLPKIYEFVRRLMLQMSGHDEK